MTIIESMIMFNIISQGKKKMIISWVPFNPAKTVELTTWTTFSTRALLPQSMSSWVTATTTTSRWWIPVIMTTFTATHLPSLAKNAFHLHLMDPCPTVILQRVSHSTWHHRPSAVVPCPRHRLGPRFNICAKWWPIYWTTATCPVLLVEILNYRAPKAWTRCTSIRWGSCPQAWHAQRNPGSLYPSPSKEFNPALFLFKITVVPCASIRFCNRCKLRADTWIRACKVFAWWTDSWTTQLSRFLYQ